MKAKEKPSEDLKERIKKTQAKAHEEVVKDGTVHFRIDAEILQLLLKISHEKRTPVGVLARMWVVERLRAELGKSQQAS